MTNNAWRLVAVHGIGGLTEVGFLAAERRVLVVSHQGRGEFDLKSGARVARDPDDDNSSSWFDAAALSCLAVSSQEWAPVAGLAGGALPRTWGRWTVTVEGERAVVVAKDGTAQTLCDGEEVRVAGFAPAGNVIVVGRAMDVWIFRQ